MVIDTGMTYTAAAATAGVSVHTVRAWVTKELETPRRRAEPPIGTWPPSRLQNRTLRAEIRRLKQEAEFLEKAAAFFDS